MKIKKTIYLDHAAATPLHPKVYKAMQPFFVNEFGNPSALYKFGLNAKKALERSRKSIADVLGAQPDTIHFTSGGTESDNLAIFGVADAVSPHLGLLPPGEEVANPLPTGEGRVRGCHIITTPIEHPAVLEPIGKLKNNGWKVTYLKVDAAGLVNPADVIKSITPNTKLISIMYANNEIGTIEPIAEIGRMLLKFRKENQTAFPYFHTDACQAAGYLDINVERLHVDLMTINGSKIYGPKGVGLLYVRRGVKISPQILGGEQERGLRAGTENVAGIIGLSKALELSQSERILPLPPSLRRSGFAPLPFAKGRAGERSRIRELSKFFWNELKTIIPNAILNGPEIGDNRLPNNINITIPDIEGEKLLIYLDAAGIACSVGSACSAEEGGVSRVIESIGKTKESAERTVRFTLGSSTTRQDLIYTVKSISSILNLTK